MAIKDLIGLRPSARPDRYPRFRPGCRHSSVFKESDCVHRVRMKARYLHRRFRIERATDAYVSKLSESNSLPSLETAIARTGPP
jgi:hypothetical protein